MFCYACSNQSLDQRDYANTDTPTQGNNDDVNKIRQNPQSVDVTGCNVITDRNHSHTNEPQNRWSDMCLFLKMKRWLLRFLQNILTALLFQQFIIAFTSCEKHFLMKMTAIMHQIIEKRHISVVKYMRIVPCNCVFLAVFVLMPYLHNTLNESGAKMQTVCANWQYYTRAHFSLNFP